MLLESGHEATYFNEEEAEQTRKDFQAHTDMVRINPGGWIYFANFTKFANDFFNFKWRSSDVVVMTYPKCGTTWSQEIIWTMRNNPNFDHPYASDPIMDRAPFFECDMFFSEIEKMDSNILKSQTPSFERWCKGADLRNGIYLQISAATPDPRTVKTHLPLSLLHPSLLDNAKVVYVVRNPKDVLFSYFHHSRLFFEHQFVGTLEEFTRYYINGDLVYGSYDKHVKEAWDCRDHPNIHLMFYEDLKANPVKEMRRLDGFLGTKLTDEQLIKIAEYTSFEQMKARDDNKLQEFYNQDIWKKDGGFFRKGQSGGWKKNLPEHIITEMDSWIEKHFNFGITFK